jgi:hypothetical protein
MEIQFLRKTAVRMPALLVIVIASLSGWLLVVSPLRTYAQDTGSSETKTAFGLQTAKFTTRQGTIEVNLPDDIAAGDSISGTVVADPAGKTDKERLRNQDELNGYVVETQNNKTGVGKKKLKWLIPAAATPGVAYLILRDRKGSEVARTPVPVRETPAPGAPTIPPTDAIHLPTIGQAGRPLQIPGPFDGDFSTTAVRIGGKEAAVLAESPRKTIVQSPADIVGPTDIHLTKGAIEASGSYRNLGIGLTATNTSLRSGETATLTIDVTGLGGLRSEIPLRISNSSASVVRLSDGDDQLVAIKPTDVRSDGSYVLTRTVTGVHVGPFNIAALVTDPNLFPPPCTLVRQPTPIAGKCVHECTPGDKRPAALSNINVAPKGQGLNVNVTKAIEDAESSDSGLKGLSVFDLISTIAETVAEGGAAPGPTAAMSHVTIEMADKLKEKLHAQAQAQWGKYGDVEVKITFTCETCKQENCHWYQCLDSKPEKQEIWDGAEMTVVVPAPQGLGSSMKPELWVGAYFDLSQKVVAQAVMNAMNNACKKK